MTLLPWQSGPPGTHQGVGHTVKHYLDPREMWDDIATAVPEPERPRSVLKRLDVPRPWLQATAPSPALAAQWLALQVTYRQGYLQIIDAAVAAYGGPPTGWARGRDGRVRAALPGGIYAVGRPAGSGKWSWVTAMRPIDFKLTDPDCPPRDPQSVSLRNLLAENAAQKKLARSDWK